MPGKSAVYFHGRWSSDKVVLPEQEALRFTGPFSVALSVQGCVHSGKVPGVGRKGDTSWQLHKVTAPTISTSTPAAAPDAPSMRMRPLVETRSPIADGTWRSRYMRACSATEPANVSILTGIWTRGANAPLPCARTTRRCGREPTASIRSVGSWGGLTRWRSSPRALSASEVAAMFDAGSPANTTRTETEKSRRGVSSQEPRIGKDLLPR